MIVTGYITNIEEITKSSFVFKYSGRATDVLGLDTVDYPFIYCSGFASLTSHPAYLTCPPVPLVCSFVPVNDVLILQRVGEDKFPTGAHMEWCQLPLKAAFPPVFADHQLHAQPRRVHPDGAAVGRVHHAGHPAGNIRDSLLDHLWGQDHHGHQHH